MTTRNQLVKYLDELYQSHLFSDVSSNGLQVEGGEKIKKAATAVSASLKTIEQAAKQKVDALIVHHGLFWSRDPYALTGAKKEKIKILIENEISLLAYHLPMDAHEPLGNNWKAALDLGWEDLQPFYKMNGIFLGVKGAFKTCSREAFQKQLEKYYGHSAAAALGGKKSVSSAALISGGAYRQIQDAAKAGADCFITGNFDEPAWAMAHEEKINFFALGHSATERVGPKALAEHLKMNLKIETLFLGDNNPF